MPRLEVARDVARHDVRTGRRRHRPGTVHTTSTRSPDVTTIRKPAVSGRDADHRRRSGRRPVRPGLGDRPGVLDRRVADDRLVGRQAAVDDVEQDRLAGHQVEDVGQERVVLRDEVDLARRVRGARARPGASWPVAAASSSRTATGRRPGSRPRRTAGVRAQCDARVRDGMARVMARPPGRGLTWPHRGPAECGDPNRTRTDAAPASLEVPAWRSRPTLASLSRSPRRSPSRSISKASRRPSATTRPDDGPRRRSPRTGNRRHGRRRHRPRDPRRRVLLDARPVRARARRRRCG